MSKYHLNVLGCEDVTALHWKQLPYIASGNAEVTHMREGIEMKVCCHQPTQSSTVLMGWEIEVGQADKATTKVDILPSNLTEIRCAVTHTHSSALSKTVSQSADVA